MSQALKRDRHGSHPHAWAFPGARRSPEWFCFSTPAWMCNTTLYCQKGVNWTMKKTDNFLKMSLKGNIACKNNSKIQNMN